KFNSSNSDIMGECCCCNGSSIHLNVINYRLAERMKNAAQSVDVVKDCFGMTEVRKNKSSSSVTQTEGTLNDDGSINQEEFHWQIVARILFIYAKLNPGQGYVQGMNEIIGPLYYVFANDPKDNWSGMTFASIYLVSNSNITLNYFPF